MRIFWLIFVGLAAATVGLFARVGPGVPARRAPVLRPAPSMLAVPTGAPASKTDSVVAFALRQLGGPYRYAGISPTTGFDCSGFVQYVYRHFGVAVPHATTLLIGVGWPKPRANAWPGDLVVFDSTAPGSTTAGHAGIVVSAAGAVPVRFVHASSARRESGVKVSIIEGTGYEIRFLQVRRVLD